MKPDYHASAKTVFEQALALDPAKRNTFLAHACGSDEHLKATVLAMLDATVAEGAGQPENSNATLPINTNLLHGPDQLSRTQDPGLLSNRYRVTRELGSGGFGVVYLAKDLQLHGRAVVVKVLNAQALQSPWARKKFDDEVQILARINHPGVVAITDTGQTNEGYPYIVMEYVEGRSLRDFAAGLTPMPLESIAEILRQLGSALSAAHSLGVCHRDLKPENILVHGAEAADIRVKLIDFGIATLSSGNEEARHSTKIIGTLQYMSPEQLEGWPTAASDVYSLGVIAYELITGALPYDAGSAVELYKLQHAGDGPLLPSRLRNGVPTGVDPLIARALSVDPAERFPSAREFALALAKQLASREESRQRLMLDPIAPRRGQAVGNPGTRVNAGRLVSKMCDRRAQEDDFRTFFVEQCRANPGKPHLYLIHGSEGECHGSLVERLSHVAERAALNHLRVVRKNIPWQYEGPLESRKRRLLSWLFEQLAGASATASIAEDEGIKSIQNLLRTVPDHLFVIQHDVRANRWDEITAQLMRELSGFIATVAQGTAHATHAHLVVFVNIIYPLGTGSSEIAGGSLIQRWWADRRVRALREQIRRFLTSMELHSSASGMACRVLDELRPVTRDDVMEWLQLHNILDSEEQRIRASTQVFDQDGRFLASRQMAEVEERLYDLQNRYLAGSL